MATEFNIQNFITRKLEECTKFQWYFCNSNTSSKLLKNYKDTAQYRFLKIFKYISQFMPWQQNLTFKILLQENLKSALNSNGTFVTTILRLSYQKIIRILLNTDFSKSLNTLVNSCHGNRI